MSESALLGTTQGVCWVTLILRGFTGNLARDGCAAEPSDIESPVDCILEARLSDVVVHESRTMCLRREQPCVFRRQATP